MCGVYCVVTFIVLFVATVVCCPADAKYDYCIAYVSDLFGKWSISSSLAFSEMWQMMSWLPCMLSFYYVQLWISCCLSL